MSAVRRIGAGSHAAATTSEGPGHEARRIPSLNGAQGRNMMWPSSGAWTIWILALVGFTHSRRKIMRFIHRSRAVRTRSRFSWRRPGRLLRDEQGAESAVIGAATGGALAGHRQPDRLDGARRDHRRGRGRRAGAIIGHGWTSRPRSCSRTSRARGEARWRGDRGHVCPGLLFDFNSTGPRRGAAQSDVLGQSLDKYRAPIS